MAKQKEAKATTSFNLGDRVRIKNYAAKVCEIVELRGALGPGGALVYRVRVPRKPSASYIELLGHQLEAVPTQGSEHTSKKRGNAREAREMS